jgi:putative acetyltransferase
LRVRAYAAADLDRLIALFRDSVRGIARRDYTLDQLLAWAPDEVDQESWRLRLAASNSWVAAEGERVAGFITLEPEGLIDMLYVDAELQGRGVATALLRRLETAASSRGLARLFTDASVTARPFFARRGFSVIAAQTVARCGVELRNFQMARQVY